MSEPLRMESIDSSSGVLFPFYDHDTRMIYVAGKGDGNVRYYELLDEEPYVYYLSQFISGAPQKGFGVMPKRGCDTTQCEIFRFYKLHATKDTIEPISMIVPRKSESFQDDIYPETQAPVPSLTAEEWISGRNASPVMMSLKAGSRIRTYKPVVYKPSENAIVISDKNNDRKFMFLSEETQPDYRPLEVRNKEKEKPCPRIDHRPLGADSYIKVRCTYGKFLLKFEDQILSVRLNHFLVRNHRTFRPNHLIFRQTSMPNVQNEKLTLIFKFLKCHL